MPNSVSSSFLPFLEEHRWHVCLGGDGRPFSYRHFLSLSGCRFAQSEQLSCLIYLLKVGHVSHSVWPVLFLM